MNVKNDSLNLTGMKLDEAKEILRNKGINEYELVVTGPPRLSNRVIQDEMRVLLVQWDQIPVKVLVCAP